MTTLRPELIDELLADYPAFLSAPWKGAFSWWVRTPPNNCRFRLVAARAAYGGNDVDRSTLVTKGCVEQFSDHAGRNVM